MQSKRRQRDFMRAERAKELELEQERERQQKAEQKARWAQAAQEETKEITNVFERLTAPGQLTTPRKPVEERSSRAKMLRATSSRTFLLGDVAPQAQAQPLLASIAAPAATDTTTGEEAAKQAPPAPPAASQASAVIDRAEAIKTMTRTLLPSKSSFIRQTQSLLGPGTDLGLGPELRSSMELRPSMPGSKSTPSPRPPLKKAASFQQKKQEIHLVTATDAMIQSFAAAPLISPLSRMSNSGGRVSNPNFDSAPAAMPSSRPQIGRNSSRLAVLLNHPPGGSASPRSFSPAVRASHDLHASNSPRSPNPFLLSSRPNSRRNLSPGAPEDILCSVGTVDMATAELSHMNKDLNQTISKFKSELKTLRP